MFVSKKAKKYYIKTFGCYANEADSNLVAGVLEKFGFEELATPVFKNEVEEVGYVLKNADVFVVNSCSVRQKSEDKVYGLGKIVGDFRKKKKDDEVTQEKSAKVFLTGCIVGSALGERKRFSIDELKKKTGNYDGYFKPGDTFAFVEVLKDFGLIVFKEAEKLRKVKVQKRQKDKKHAFVNVSYGCDNFCSYCVVPYARGGEISRSEEDILQEIECLVKNGVSEITLCGQNVNSWGLNTSEKLKIRTGSRKKLPFAQLLRKVYKISEVKKIDFISSNPFDFTQDLVDAIKLSKVSNYIHIAVQSGNNDVLKSMNRRHMVEEFLDLIKRLRKVRPNIEIGTDLIVGFPGETRKQFVDTVNLVKKAKFAVAFIAMYSPRKGTFAEMKLKDSVSLKEKKWRHKKLLEAWMKSKGKMVSHVGSHIGRSKD